MKLSGKNHFTSGSFFACSLCYLRHVSILVFAFQLIKSIIHLVAGVDCSIFEGMEALFSSVFIGWVYLFF